jgi:Beta-lactamase
MTLAAETRATTVRVPTVPDHVRLVWVGSLPRRRLDDKAAGSWDRKERLMGSTRRTPPATPARRHDAPAALVHRLVEEACNGGNLAALADTLGKWLPQYRAWRRIQIKQLLNMTSGIQDLEDQPAFLRGYAAAPNTVFSTSRLVSYVVGLPLQKGWNYSNTNYILAQMIIERVTHDTYADQLRKSHRHWARGDYIHGFGRTPSTLPQILAAPPITAVRPAV